MTQKDETLETDLNDLEQEIEILEESQEDEQNIKNTKESDEILKLKDLLNRTQADYLNFKTRSERDREDMMFFLKYDILKKILPRIDDIERIIKNTKDEEKNSSLFDGLLILEKSLKQDLKGLGVEQFDSIGQEIDPNKHEVMTQIPSPGNEGKIIDEFEKGYILGDRTLRVAKVVVGC
ncbi:nucleotide exchange factor GrpE [Candidatus Gracilibacteria bacterium]|nr:nucleotide exchange factor GrpE [Candidatus Gracilibacteria bacterium]